MTFKLIVDAFREGATIPRRHSCDGENLSPALAWENVPLAARSLALIVDDPDAPARTWNHWLLWDLPAGVEAVEEGFQPGDAGVSGTNDLDSLGYGGPCPPRGHGAHRYYIRLYALDVESLELGAGARRGQLDGALRGHVLAEALYMGRYERR
jgi:Raf kinase inhibitor-like YbhB/YbcL family protein